MAAWTARIDSIAAGASSTITITVEYFDAADTAFTAPLAEHMFVLPANAPLSEARQSIVQWGADQRAFQTRVANAAANWTGATINIP